MSGKWNSVETSSAEKNDVFWKNQTSLNLKPKYLNGVNNQGKASSRT
jgi:hypothetical protein|tara:strand:- start:1008 stop:1148 length:141 start_codon:yes stop_codon:yes gene_type:complete